jgi:hypothetical protein
MTKSRHILRPRRAWSEFELEVLRLHYATTVTADLAELLGRQPWVVSQKACVIGLRKTREHLAQIAHERSTTPGHGGNATRFGKGHVPANKGTRRPGYAPGNRAKGQFKAGERHGMSAHNWRPIGSYRVNTEGVLDRKVRDDGPPQRRWVAAHRLVWIEANGPIPPDCAVVFKPGHKTVDPAELTVDRLECLTRAQLLDRNRYPPDLQRINTLRGAITRAIKRKEGARP